MSTNQLSDDPFEDSDAGSEESSCGSDEGSDEDSEGGSSAADDSEDNCVEAEPTAAERRFQNEVCFCTFNTLSAS